MLLNYFFLQERTSSRCVRQSNGRESLASVFFVTETKTAESVPVYADQFVLVALVGHDLKLRQNRARNKFLGIDTVCRPGIARQMSMATVGPMDPDIVSFLKISYGVMRTSGETAPQQLNDHLGFSGSEDKIQVTVKDRASYAEAS